MSQNRYRVRFHERPLSDSVIKGLHGMHREVGNFFLTQSNYPPNMRVPQHSHENTNLYLVLGGRIGDQHGSRATEHKPGTLVLTPAGEPHSNYTDMAGGHCFLIDIKSLWLDSIREPSLELNQWVHFEGGVPVALARRAYYEAWHFDPFSPLVIEGVMLELLADMFRRKAKPESKCPRWLEQAREMLHERFAERISISELAFAVGRHPVHLAAQFRHTFGCTVGEYIRQLRIEFACREIVDSQKPLIQIAIAAGFSDQGHFCRTFKTLRGVTPSYYRATFGRTNQRQTPWDYSSNHELDVV